MGEQPSNGDWSLTNNKGYILNRDRNHAAACRLNLQFYLWRSALKFNIHPSVQPSLPKNPVIADVASGTGVWLTQVAQEFPEGEFSGLDYNLEQAPHEKNLPSNIRMRHWNVFKPVPDDLVGKFDYIHTRLLLLVVEAQNPRPVLQNLLKMLKPGGYLQWDELDTVNATVKKVDQDQQTPALDYLLEWSMASGRHDWTVKLANFCEEEGFEDCKAHFYGDPPELARAFSEQHLLTAEEFAEGLVKLGKEDVAVKYFQSVRDAYDETVKGASLCVPRLVCVARKPL